MSIISKLATIYLTSMDLKAKEAYLEDCLSRIKTTTGLSFKSKIFEVGNDLILELKNLIKETTIKGYVSKIDDAEKWVMSWEGDRDQTFPTLENLLDAVPDEYDSELSLFETKESLDNVKAELSVAMGTLVGKLKWKLEKSKTGRTLFVSGKDNSKIYVKTCAFLYSSDYDRWSVIATLQINQNKDKVLNVISDLKSLCTCSYDEARGQLDLNLKNIGSLGLLTSTIENIFDTLKEEIV